MAEKGGSSVWLWVGLGCGGLFLVLLCVGGAGAWFFFAAKERAEVASSEFDRAMQEQRQAEEQARLAQEEAARQAQLAQQGVPGLPGVPPPLPAGPRPTDPSPRMISAQVTSVTGNPGVAPGNECTFAVEMHDAADRPGGYWCRANVMCGLTLLYGGGNSGYFPCTVMDSPRGVVGQDVDTTASDNDGAFEIDSRSGRLAVRDDARGHLGAFSVEARITGVR